jgi:anti-sigma factor RsiW
MGSDTLHDLTAAYALEALDETERREYEAHLAHCERCRDELGSFSEAAATLAYAVGGPPPPPQLRARILERARAERPNVVPLRPRWAVPAAVTAVAAVAAAVALAIWATTLSNHVDSLQTQRSQQERVAAVLSAAGRRTYTFGTHGRLVVAPSGEAALVFTGLPAARDGKTYEAWVANGGAPRAAGTFAARAGLTAFPLRARVPAGATVMITQERSGGTDKPTESPEIAATTS